MKTKKKMKAETTFRSLETKRRRHRTWREEEKKRMEEQFHPKNQPKQKRDQPSRRESMIHFLVVVVAVKARTKDWILSKLPDNVPLIPSD